MKKVEVLCTTMFQSDVNLYEQMNLNTHVVFCNQSNENAYFETSKKLNQVKMVTTHLRGVGKNRNIGLLYATGDICLLSDDDVIYYDNYKETIINAYEELPKADIIIFNMEYESKRQIKSIKKAKRLRYFQAMKFGAVNISFLLDPIKRNQLYFSELFGGGAKFLSGEDSLFLIQAFQKGLKIYTYPEKLGYVKDSDSTWYRGITEEFLESKGAFLHAGFKYLKIPIRILFAFKFSRNSKFSILQAYKHLKTGSIRYKKMKSVE